MKQLNPHLVGGSALSTSSLSPNCDCKILNTNATMKSMLLFQKQLIALLCFLGITTSTLIAQSFDVVVAKDNSGAFTSLQAAINAAPTNRTTPYKIFIKNGIYKEKINIPSNKPFIQLIGESVANVILTWDDFSGKPIPGGGTYGTSTSATFTVTAADFTAINITFENTTGESPQALAIYVSGDRSAFKNCRFLGGQDTIFAGTSNARQYFRNCYIDGTVDFIFGDSRAIFDSCIIYAKTRSSSGGSYITAANTKQVEPYGYVFRNCKIIPNRGGTVYVLGRPWQNDASTPDASKSYNKTIFLNTTMGSSVSSAGWSVWNEGTDVSKITYAEYKSKNFDGSLVNTSSRVSWSKQLTDQEAAVYYDNSNLFGTWDPCSVYPDFCINTPSPIAVSNFKGVKGTNTSSFTWNISWPMTGIKYEVLRSSDKATFTKVNEQTATNDSSANFGYTENIPPPGVTYYYIVSASKAGLSTHITDTVAISSTPTITVSGALGSFIQGVGTPSNPQSYTVSGSSLTNNLIITAPAGYEISANNGTSWNNSNNPIVLTPASNGNVLNTPISVRLNATAAGSYNGNIAHASTGADTVRLAVSGTVQSAPLAVSQMLQWYPMAVNNTDSASVRAAGVLPATTTFSNYTVSNEVTYDATALPAYSAAHGQAISGSPNGQGDWRTSSGGPGSTLNRGYYEQFVIKAGSTHSVRVDSLILNTGFYASSSSTRIAVQYSKTGFAADSSELSGASIGGSSATYVSNNNFTKAILVPSDNNAASFNIRYAISGAEGINLASGDSLTIRVYFSCGSTSRNRYAKLKDVQFKGLTTQNPVAGDYRSKQSGNWIDLSTWERFDGTQWISPAPDYPHFSNTSGTQIMGGHTVTHATNFTSGFGYIPRRTKINAGGQLIVSNSASLNVGNDGTPAAGTIDLQIDGTLTLLGSMGTNGNVFVQVNGTFINSGTAMNVSNGGDTMVVTANAVYQHNVNNAITPTRLYFDPSATFRITGLTTAQTSLFRNAVQYGNIVWNNTAQANYYAIRTTLDSNNVKGSFTVQSTGSTNLTFANTSHRLSLPGGYYQKGGIVNYRESGNVTDTLDLGGDFSVTGGTFNSNAGAGSSLLIRLNGTNKIINYSQASATNTNWEVNGSYNAASNINVPSAGYAVIVKGSLNFGASPYMVTNGVSFLKIINVGATNTPFAVGPTSTSYNPVTITNAGTVDNFSISVKTTFDVAVPDANKVVNRQWTINEDIAGGSNATISLSWTTADQAAGFNAAQAVSILRYNGATWDKYPATVTGAGTTANPFEATASNITSFSPFVVINESALPLTLLSFNAGYINNDLQISWKTANEVNTKLFVVERSADGKVFTEIGSLKANTLNRINSYTITDQSPLDGIAYYRLKSIDNDGAFKHSNIVSVSNRAKGKLSVYPNPAMEVITLTHDKAATKAMINIYTLDGKKVIAQQPNINATQTSIQVAHLIRGGYLLMLRNGTQTSTIRFLKK